MIRAVAELTSVPFEGGAHWHLRLNQNPGFTRGMKHFIFRFLEFTDHKMANWKLSIPLHLFYEALDWEMRYNVLYIWQCGHAAHPLC